MKFLTAFDYGKATVRADGTSEREYLVVAEDKEIEVAEGVKSEIVDPKGSDFPV